MVPIATTSKFEAVMVLSRFKLELFQRSSGVPLIKIPLPLSARIIPYFFRAVRITRSSGGERVISKLALRRSRVPMGGALVLATVEAQCDAGATKAFWVVGTVNRSAWLMAPAATSS